MTKYTLILLCLFAVTFPVAAQDADPPTPPEPPKIRLNDPKAEAVIDKAVKYLGGEKYLNVRTQIGKGKYSIIRDGAVISLQSFIDIIVHPDKERTEFKGGGVRTIQTNTGNTGWLFDGEQELIKEQTERQIDNFKRGLRTSLDNLLRKHWKGEAFVEYIGKRPSTLGKRNAVIKLVYDDGFAVEFEFADDTGVPQKAIYKRTGADGTETTEEDRYAQFISRSGIRTPYIIDRRSDGKPNSRINYESVDFNEPVADSMFTMPTNKKDL